MDKKTTYRLRIQNCIWTIIDVHNMVKNGDEDGEFLSQFRDLEKNIQDLDMTHISETDVMMVEQATNVVLGEFRPLFESGAFGSVYEFREN